MRIPSLCLSATLIIGGFAPAPLPAAPGLTRPDPEAVCAPYLAAFDAEDDVESIVLTATRIPSPRSNTPPPPAPPPPPALPPPPPSAMMSVSPALVIAGPARDRERYGENDVAGVRAVAEAPVSTFSIDVDTGSYANARRMLEDGRMPPQDAVRTEEMLNYFRYDYPAPTDRAHPFTITADMSRTPWNAETRLLRIGLRGYDIPRSERPAANLVFLVDVSGSMHDRDKLPLVQCSLALLAERLNARDRVSIVAYAGRAGVVLEPTHDKEKVVASLAQLEAGGSTAGAAGIQLAYDLARRNMVDGGINRIVLATDGDFNVGVSDDRALVDMVERERKAGITLTTLGFGTGNFNEAMMEQIADHGNGNYAYIDSPREAGKVLDQELSSTLFTIAGDVKIQVEFNPAYVREYRLIGYENRLLAEEDFDNDAVDAGEIGAGHQVTALYEIVPAGAKGWLPERHFEANRQSASGAANGQLAWLRLRYKVPGEDQSRLIEQPVAFALAARAAAPSGDTAFAAAVAAYGQLLRGDARMNGFTFADAKRLAQPVATGDYWREEFLRLTDLAAKEMPDARRP